MFGRLALISLTLTLTTAARGADTPSTANPTQEIMQKIFAPVSTALGYSFDQDTFAAPANRPKVGAALKTLAGNATLLEEHGKGQDRAFEYVARSLARDARNVNRWYAAGQYERARFTLNHLTENCLTCHANLPETRKFPPAESFFTQVDVARLSPLDRAQLQIMSRRFDDALATYEAFFRGKDLDPTLVPLLGAFTDYLKLSISVKSDFKRPQPILAYLAARPTMPLHLRQQLQRWSAALQELDARNILQKPSLAEARQLLTEGRGLMEFQRDRDGLIHYLTAEAILSRLVRGRPDTGGSVATGEAYYLLGTASALSEHSLWITRSDFYLESAIRLAPAAAFAPKAYAMLEENLVAGYSGSSGTHMPEDVKLLLAELKRLVEQEHGKKN